MIRRTTPAVSFTTSHRALMLRSSRTLLGNEMNSTARVKAAWDEMPFNTWGFSNKQRFEWHWRCMFELGLRDTCRNTKSRQIFLAMIAIAMGYYVLNLIWPAYWYRIVFLKWPDKFANPDAGRQDARNKGYDVWCADGKFVRPFFHLNAPMFTMRIEDL